MRIDILTLFPTIAAAPLGESMIGKAQQRGLVTIQTHNLRAWARDKHRTTDDTPYGGSQGMVMKCEPYFAAVEAILAEARAQQPGQPPAEPGSELAASLQSGESPLLPTVHSSPLASPLPAFPLPTDSVTE